MPIRSNSAEREVGNFFNLSGAAMNRTRTPSPRCRTPTRNVTGRATPLHIDLHNLEDPRFENSKYVLTSPRSLEACARFSIKPVELLYKPLIDFQEELVPEGFSIRAIYELYDQHERERQNKLQLCREEREQIIDEDNRLGRTYTAPVINQSKSSPRIKPVTLTSKSMTRGKRDDSNESKPLASLQRARTAWTTSVGHERVTQEELNARAEEMSQSRPKKAGIMKTGRPRKPNIGAGKTQNKKVKVIATKKPMVTHPRKKEERQQKQQQHSSHESISDASSGASGSAGSARNSRPWIKDPSLDARPISDHQLKQKLQGIVLDSTRLTPRLRSGSSSTNRQNRYSAPVMRSQDQKILKLMLEKREQEKNMRESRETNKWRWEEERQKEAARKNAAENQRRQSMDEVKLQREAQKTEILQRKRSEEDSMKKEREAAVEQCQRSHSEASQKQLELKRRKIQEKKMRELERRKSVEERLELQRKELEDYNEKVRQKQANELERAQSLKMNKEQQVAMRAKLKNSQARRKHEEKMNEIKRKSCEDLQSLRLSLDSKLNSASLKHKTEMQRKEQELRKSKLEYDKKIKETRENQQKLEEEMQAWQDELMNYRKTQEQRAEEAAKDQINRRKQKILEDRITRGKMQRENLQKLLMQDEEYRASLEATLAMKEARTRALMTEREEMIQESRALSAASQRLREEVRHHYSMNDLDKLNQQALMEARLAIRGSQSNMLANQMSRVTMG